jgi:hypothetical protein
MRDERIVARFFAVCANIQYVDALLFQIGLDVLFELKTGVI